MACNGKPGDDWKFYEIDPVVVRIAKDPARFSFLSRCTPDAPIVVGDARLTLAKEQPASFDYLVVDAFSSDAIPVHLLTVEAIELYLSKLSEKGVLALHVSNRHLDLPPIVAATVARTKAAGAVYVLDLPEGPAFDVSASQVILIAKDKAGLEAAMATKGARMLKPGKMAAWTDDYSNILGALADKRLR
jgi:spermidine synthase